MSTISSSPTPSVAGASKGPAIPAAAATRKQPARGAAAAAPPAAARDSDGAAFDFALEEEAAKPTPGMVSVGSCHKSQGQLLEGWGCCAGSVKAAHGCRHAARHLCTTPNSFLQGAKPTRPANKAAGAKKGGVASPRPSLLRGMLGRPKAGSAKPGKPLPSPRPSPLRGMLGGRPKAGDKQKQQAAAAGPLDEAAMHGEPEAAKENIAPAGDVEAVAAKPAAAAAKPAATKKGGAKKPAGKAAGEPVPAPAAAEQQTGSAKVGRGRGKPVFCILHRGGDVQNEETAGISFTPGPLHLACCQLSPAC